MITPEELLTKIVESVKKVD